MLIDPDTACVPVQSPLAVQLVAFALLHVRVELPPLDTLVGEAAKFNVGAAAGCCTVTVAVALLEPPGPVQFSEKLELADNGPTLCEPLVATLPDQPPDAAQLVAFVADHVSVLEPPLVTFVGLAVNVVTGALGGGAAATCALADALVVPPRPTQLSLYVCEVCNGPTDPDPSTSCRPFQSPEALQRNEPLDDHDNVAVAPAETLAGLTAIETIGAVDVGCCCCACATVAICVSSEVAIRAARPSNVTWSALVIAAFNAVRASAAVVDPSRTM